MVPKILVVLFLPKEGMCLDFDFDKLLLYGKAYWKSLKGMEENTNHTSTTIYLAHSQRFTEEALQELMIAASNREEFAHVPC